MNKSHTFRRAINTVTDQPTRKDSKANIDPLAKIRPMISKKPQLVPTLPSRSSTLPVSSGLKMLNTRIQSTDDPSYQPLVTISDHENTEDDEEENFISPIQKLTKKELREELQVFNPKSQSALLVADDDDDDDNDDDLQFRIQQPAQRCVCCLQYRSSCAIS